MASVKRTTAGRYRVRWRDADGRERSKNVRTMDAARRFGHQVEVDRDRGLMYDPRAGRLPVAEVWRELRDVDSTRLSPSTLNLYDLHWRRYIGPALGGRRVASVTRTDVETMARSLLADGVGSATVAAVVRLTHRIFEVAVQADRIVRNPARGVRRPTPEHRGERVLTPDEVWKLADAVPVRWRAAVLVLAWCGLRIGELAALTVDRVDFLRRSIRVTEQVVEVKGGLYRRPTKTGHRRSVPVPAFVLDEISAHIAREGRKDGPLFAGRNGGLLRRHAFRSRVFAPAVGRAGVGPLRIHDLRHTAVSIALSTGAPLKAVQALAGHASAAMTADRYGHMLPSVAEDVSRRMDDVGRAAHLRHIEAMEQHSRTSDA